MKIHLALIFVVILAVSQGFSTAPPTNLTDNIARRKTTAQSSSYFPCYKNNCRGDPSRAVDGNKDPDFHAGSCISTKYQRNPWWRVDLEKREVVRKVSLTNRGDCCAERLRALDIRVGDYGCSWSKNPVCQFFDGEVASGATIDFYCQKRGRFLFVRLHNTAILTLCEVEVFAEKGASLPWTKGNESCTWERRLTPSWVAAPVISILIFCCCCCCRSQHLRQSQSTNQVAANSSNRPPRESNTSIQSQTSAIRRPESPSMESTDLQGSVSTDGNGDTEFSIKDPPPRKAYSIRFATSADAPPPSYQDAVRSNNDNAVFQIEPTSINYASFGDSMGNAPPPPYSSLGIASPSEPGR